MMKDLDPIFEPKSIAVIGASNQEGSVGYGLFNNLKSYEGDLYAVNPKREQVQNYEAYDSVQDIAGDIDLAIIAVPAPIVPQIAKECGEKGIKGAIIVSSGFKETGPEGIALEEKVGQIAGEYGIKLIGPNCLGIINTLNGLNASFASRMPTKGQTVVLSQSGALGSAIIEWSLEQNIGIRSFVSVGSMLDVDFADLVAYFNEKEDIRGIVIYMESVKNSQKFLQEARNFVKNKPIVVLKAGSTEAGSRAAVSHTGFLAGNEKVYEAAFKQNGILQIENIEDVFTCLKTLCLKKLPDGLNLGVVTNAGGAGVMAVDEIKKKGGELAQLEEETIDSLNQVMPEAWSQGNPIDVLGDASAQRYEQAITACFEDQNVDGVLVIFTPQYSSEPEKTARIVSKLNQKYNKPLVASWIGPEGMDRAREILNDNEVSNYTTPEEAVRAFLNIYNHHRSQKLLSEREESSKIDVSPNKDRLNQLLKETEGEVLSEEKSKQFLSEYEIPTVNTVLAKNEAAAVKQAEKLGYPVALKVQSSAITHKSDVGGVQLFLHNERDVRNAFQQIKDNLRENKPAAELGGVAVETMVTEVDYELILGSKHDPDFGPVILFGNGGINVEIYDDTAIGLPPLNEKLAERVINDTKISDSLQQGYRNRKKADMKALQETVARFSQLVLDFPQIKEIDINPLAIEKGKPIALDARIIKRD